MNNTSDNTEKSFKCSNCGVMFSCCSEENMECPYCHHHFHKGECKKMGSSNEGF